MNLGGLYFGSGIDMSEWRKNIQEMRSDILGLTQQTQRETSQMDTAFKNMSIGIGAYFSATALQGFTQQLINVRGEFQKTEIAFSTMLKSSEKSRELMGQMVDLAAKTPFALTDVTDGAKRLLAFQVPAEQVVDTLTRIGNVSAGLGVPMGQLIHVYGQVKAQGKLMTNDLYQFMNAGIPMVAELAKVMGVAENEVKDLISAGKIGFPEVQQVINQLTNEGGMFFNLMEEQSKSLSGQVANLEDSVEQMFNKIGESSEGFLSSGIQGITFLVENYEKVAIILAGLVATYGAYRTALIATMVVENIRGRILVQQAVAQGTLSTAQAFGAVVTMNLQRATAMLNATMMANPYAIAVAGVVGLVAVLWGLDTATESVQDKLQRWSNETKEIKSQAEGLITVIKNETATYLEKADALDKLQSLAPETFANMTQEQIMAMDLTETYKLLNEELERQEAGKKNKSLKDMKEELESLMKLKDLNVDDASGSISSRIAELKQGIADLEYADKKRTEALMAQNEPLEKQLEYWNEEERKINDVIDAIKKKYPELDITKAKAGEIPPEIAKMQTAIDGLNFAQLLDRFRQVQNYARSVRNELSSIPNALNKPMGEMNKNEVDSKIKALQEEKALLSDVKEIAKKQAEIDKYRRLSRKWEDTKLESSTPKKAKSPTKSQINAPIKGSLGALEAELSAINTKLQNKTLLSDAKTREKLLSEREKLEKRIAEIKRRYNKQSFDEEMQEMKRQISVRDKLLQAGYSQQTVDEMFPKVKDQSYISYLESTKTKLEELIKTGKGTEEVAQNLFKIKDEIKDYNNEKNFIDNLSESIDRLKNKYSGLELINKLDDLNRLDVNQTEEETRLKSNLIRQTKEQELKRMKESYDSFLNEHKSYEEKRLAITKEYDGLRLQAQKEYEEGRIDKNAYDSVFGKIAKNEAEKISKLQMEILKESGDWELAFSDLEYVGRESINRLIERLEAFKSAQAKNLQPTELRELNNVLDKLRQKANLNPFKGVMKGFSEFKKSKEKLKKAQEEYNEAVEKFGKTSQEAITANNKLSQSELKVAESKKKIAEDLSKSQDIFNAVEEGVMELADAFGGLDEATKDAVEDIMAVGNAALDLGQSIAKGDVAGMIKSGFKLIGSIVSSLNGDKRKERAIQREKRAIEGLKTAYEDLAHAANKAFGSRKYSSQTGLIQNLEQQKIHLQNMIRQEDAKKKTDHGKISDWQNQVSAINRSIEDIKDNVIKDVLQTDLFDASAKFGDALVDAFNRGEDAGKSFENVVDGIVQNMLKNQLNLQMQERIKKPLEDLFKSTGLNSDGSGVFDLSKGEIEAFKQQVKERTAGLQGFMEAYKEIFSGVENADKSLSGAMSRMSEETGSVLVGQFNAIRINTGEITKNSGFSLEVLRQHTSIFRQIELNTQPLRSIYLSIKEIENKIKSNSGSVRAGGG